MATSIKIDDELKSRIKHLATARDRTAHWIMREAIKQYVDREESKESFRDEALLAWREYSDAGQHVTGEEVIAWLERAGTAEETAFPECHD
ncbi:CopG family ribbon-helix-helix protein [Sphingomonas sp. RT2P30]|uniref:CopG family ribbon-helix-helix protein n=1 Tax=Parasphingomonas halimpatiens TaxID=3096162 RepID=UPI002FC815A4